MKKRKAVRGIASQDSWIILNHLVRNRRVNLRPLSRHQSYIINIALRHASEIAETLRYIRSNQEEVLDKYENVTKNKLIREEILVQRNHLKETSFDGAVSFEVEKELFNKPMLKDRLNEAQKSNISNICKKIVPTEKGFDNHTANLHTKKSPG